MPAEVGDVLNRGGVLCQVGGEALQAGAIAKDRALAVGCGRKFEIPGHRPAQCGLAHSGQSFPPGRSPARGMACRVRDDAEMIQGVVQGVQGDRPVPQTVADAGFMGPDGGAKLGQIVGRKSAKILAGLNEQAQQHQGHHALDVPLGEAQFRRALADGLRRAGQRGQGRLTHQRREFTREQVWVAGAQVAEEHQEEDHAVATCVEVGQVRRHLIAVPVKALDALQDAGTVR